MVGQLERDFDLGGKVESSAAGKVGKRVGGNFGGAVGGKIQGQAVKVGCTKLGEVRRRILGLLAAEHRN